MLKVGLTGGIGSGKSVVARVFETLGIPVYYADARAKVLMNEEPLRSRITEIFGKEAYTDDHLNRAWIAKQVFTDNKKLEQLNELVHPVTISDAENWFISQSSLYAVKEAALIFEAGSEKKLDYVIGVSAPDEIRISRTMQRDKITKEEVLQRMNKQYSQDENMSRCDFVVINDDVTAILPQVLDIDRVLRSIALNV